MFQDFASNDRERLSTNVCMHLTNSVMFVCMLYDGINYTKINLFPFFYVGGGYE